MPNWNEILDELKESGSVHDVIRRKYLGRLHERTGRNVIIYYSGWLQESRMESVVCNVRDIENEERRFYESVLGEPLRDNQRVFIMVLDPGAPADEAIRRKAMDHVLDLARKGTERRERSGVSVEEADRIVDEAIQYVRRHKDE